MKPVLVYLVLAFFFSFAPALFIGALLSLIDGELGVIVGGAVFGWRFTEFLLKRKGKW